MPLEAPSERSGARPLRIAWHPEFDNYAIIDCIDCMPSITIRMLPSRTKERLRLQAARSGLSLEAHARVVLQRASEADETGQIDLVTLAQQCFGSANGINLDLPPVA